MKTFVSLLAVLAAGLPPDRALPDSGRVLRSGPPSLPQQRLEGDQDGNLLLCGRHQRDSCVPLGLAEQRIHFGSRAGAERRVMIKQAHLTLYCGL